MDDRTRHDDDAQVRGMRVKRRRESRRELVESTEGALRRIAPETGLLHTGWCPRRVFPLHVAGRPNDGLSGGGLLGGFRLRISRALSEDRSREQEHRGESQDISPSHHRPPFFVANLAFDATTRTRLPATGAARGGRLLSKKQGLAEESNKDKIPPKKSDPR